MATVWMILLMMLGAAAPQDTRTSDFNQKYKDRAVAAAAETLESAASAPYRYRVHIVNLLQLKPGMAAAQIGAGSGYVARLIAQRVAPDGKVTATDPDPRMVAYLNERAKAEAIANLTARVEQPSAAGLDAGSLDAIAVVGRFSTYSRPADVLSALTAALKPGGLLLVVDTPHEGQGAAATGIDADDVIALADAAGLDRVDENGAVPGHYSLRFRKR